MKEKKMDRRVQYTTMVLKQALVQAMQTQHISKISVKALCEAADVNRSTFYAHYSDQYDLLYQMQDEVIGNIKSYLDEQLYSATQPISSQALKGVLDYVQDDADLFRALLSENNDSDIQIKIMEFAQLFPIKRYGNTDKRIMDYLISFGTTGCLSIIRKWLQDGMPEGTMEISQLIIAALHHGVEGFD